MGRRFTDGDRNGVVLVVDPDRSVLRSVRLEIRVGTSGRATRWNGRNRTSTGLERNRLLVGSGIDPAAG